MADPIVDPAAAPAPPPPPPPLPDVGYGPGIRAPDFPAQPGAVGDVWIGSDQALAEETGRSVVSDNVADSHKVDLANRQAAADQVAQQEEDLHEQLKAPQKPQVVTAGITGDQAAAIGSDVVRGVGEAGPRVVTGAKQAINSMLDLADHLGDSVEHYVPGTLTWSFPTPDHPEVPWSIDLKTAAQAKQEGYPGGAPRIPVGENEKPASVTGALIQGTSQFATGWLVGGKILKGWTAATRAMGIVKGMAQGALTDFSAFDGYQGRLSDLLKGHAPEALKPVLDYLSTDPSDGMMEARLKNALEGLGLGVATEGILRAARGLKAARLARAAAGRQAAEEGLQGTVDATQAAVQAEANKFASDLKGAVGDAASSKFTFNRKLTPQQIEAARKSGKVGENEIGLNYAKIADAKGMQAAAVEFYDAHVPNIGDAKRGVQAIDKQVADAFGEDVSKLLGKWEPGTAMLSHELTALRFAQAGAMKDFAAAARAIARGDSTPAAQAAFLQVGGVLHALTRAVEGGKAEAARTLRTLRETVPSLEGRMETPEQAVELYRKVDALIAANGGKDTIERAAKQFLSVAAHNPAGSSKFLRWMGHYDKFQKNTTELLNVFMTNGLLSIPGNVANVIGNASAMVWEPMMRTLAPHLSDAVGAPSYVAKGEGLQMMVGMKAAFGDIFRLAPLTSVARAPWREKVGALGEVIQGNWDQAKANTQAFVKQQREEVQRARESSPVDVPTGLERGPDADTPLGRVSRLLMGAVKIPGAVNGLMDDFTKIVSGRAELHAQAYRAAMKESETGAITAAEVGARMQQLIEDPSADMLQKVIDAQLELSWTRKPDTAMGGLVKGLTSVREGLNGIPVPLPLGTSILPFVRTPANVASYGIRNSALAPLSTRWWQEVLSGDGATRQLALTKFAVGGLFTMQVIDAVADGRITGGGPSDPAQKQAMARVDPTTGQAMWQPYSVRIGDRWYDYSRMDPIATPLSISADTAEGWLATDWTDERAETAFEHWSHAAMNVGNAFMNKSTMQGVAQLTDALSSAKRGDVGTAERFMAKRALSATPFSSVSGSLRRATDPYQREVTGLTDAFKNNTPGMSADLQPSLDLWGRKRTYESGVGGVYDFLVPMRSHPVGGEPVDREMVRLGVAKQMPPRSIDVRGLNISLRNHPEIYNEILARGGPPAMQELNDLVSGAHPNSGYYEQMSDGPDGQKARYIKGRLDFYFGQARASVKRDFADELSDMAGAKLNRRAEARQ